MQRQQTTSLDATDLKILDILQQDAKLEIRQIAKRVHKSPSPVCARIHKLQEQGYIKRYVAVIDLEKIGRPFLMVTQVKLKHHEAHLLKEFSRMINTFPEVQLCLHLSGEYDFLLQVSLKDPHAYKEFLDHKLCCIPLIDKVQSSLVLEECKVGLMLPLIG